MNSKRAFRITIALAVVAAGSFVGIQSAAAVSGSITGYTAPVNLTFEGGATAGAALITLTTADQEPLLAYCIDLHTNTGMGVAYDEGSWTQANVPDVAKVTAILRASYPVRTVEQLGQSLGTTMLTEAEAIAGTQAAIWHFTDLVNLDREVPAQNATSNIGMVYDYLLRVAESPVVEPAPALSITPSTVAATVARMVGPFTLHVTPAGAIVTVTNNSGAGFSDSAGNAVVPTKDGDQFWITPTAAGNFTVNASADVAVPTGRVFLHTPSDTHQKLVLAKSDAVTTTATAAFESTPLPTTTTEAQTTTTAVQTTTTEAQTTTTAAPTTTAATTTTTAATTTTTAATTTTTAAAATTSEPTTTTAAIVAALPPVAALPIATFVPTNAVLPATGSSSTVPGLLVAAGILFVGVVLTAATRRRLGS